MGVGELDELYRKAQAVRDETVRQNMLQSIAQTAGTADALEKARDDPGFGSGDSKADIGTEHLVELAQSELDGAGEASAKLLGERGKPDVSARAAEAVAAEAVAAEAVAAEALAAEALAAEPAEVRFSAEPLAAEASMLSGAFAEGTEAIGSSLRSFVDKNTERG